MVEANKSTTTALTDKTLIDTDQKKVIKQTETGHVAVGYDPSHKADSGIIQMASTLSKGQVPSNAEIESTLDKAKESLADNQSNLTSKGKQLANDAQQVLESAQLLLENKNRDETLQKIVKEANLLGKEATTTASSQMQGEQMYATFQSEVLGDQYTADLAKQALNNARDLVWFLIRSSDFRGFLFDLIDLFQSMVRDIDRKHGDSLNASLKSDVNREDSGMQQTRQTASNIAQDLKEGSLGDDSKKQSIQERFEDLLFRLSNNPQYNRALDNIYALVHELSGKVERIRNQAPDTQLLDPNDRSQVIMNEAYDIFIRFVDEQDWIKFQNHFWDLYTDLNNDLPARQFFYDLRQYLQKQIENPELINDEYRKNEAKNFVERAKNLFNLEQNKYQVRFQDLFDRATNLLNQIRYDEDTQRLTSSINKLAKDLVLDEQGKPDLFVAQESIGQLREMLIPLIQKQLENVPLPLIEGSTDKYDYRLDNMTLNGRNILPDRFDLKFVSNLEMGHKYHSDKAFTKLKLRADNIRLALNDIHFWYHRKVMPKLSDEGIADVKMGGRGLDFRMVWKLSAKENRPWTIELDSVKCYIDKLDINIKKSHHSIINKIAVTLFSGTIKRRIANTIVEKTREALEPMNEQLNDFFRRQREWNLTEKANVKLKQAYDVNWQRQMEGKSVADEIQEKVGEKKEEIQEKMEETKEELKMKTTAPPSTTTATTVTTSTIDPSTWATGKYANVRSQADISNKAGELAPPTSTTTTSAVTTTSPTHVDAEYDLVENEKYHGVWRKTPKSTFADNENPFKTTKLEEDIIGPPTTL